MKTYYAALCHNNSYNLGNWMQTIAAIQYLPRVDLWIDKNTNAVYDHDFTKIPKRRLRRIKNSTVKIIYNGWFNKDYTVFPPLSWLEPIFTSFYIDTENYDCNKNFNVLERINDAKPITYYREYLDKYAPIGGRSEWTCNLLSDENIPNYFSGCLTLTLSKPYLQEKFENCFSGCASLTKLQLQSKYILVVDAQIDSQTLFNEYVLPKLKCGCVKYSRQTLDKLYTNEEQLEMAKKLIRQITRAKLVITSQLQTALTAFAYNKPVVFVNTNLDDPMFSGLLSCPKIGYDINSELYISNPDIDYSTYTWDNMQVEFDTQKLLDQSKKMQSIIHARLFKM